MSLLVLGWKPRLDTILPDLGMNTIVVLGSSERRLYGDETRRYGTVIDLADKCDIGRLLPALSRLGAGDISAVYTDQETSLVPAAVLASHFGARGPSVASALLSRDKWLQKQAAQRGGLPVPRHWLVSGDDDERSAALRAVPYPAVLKPISDAGARHTAVVHSAEAARTAISAVGVGVPDAEAFLLEAVIDGREMHADGLVHEGELAFLSISRYRSNVLAARSHGAVGSAVLDPRSEPEYYRRIRSFATAVIGALRLRDTAFHLEFFETADGLVFSECGARTGGTWVTDAVQAKFGVDLRRAGVEVATGRPPTLTGTPSDSAIGWTYLPVPHGQVVAMPPLSRLLDRPGVRRATINETAISQAAPNAGANRRRAGLALLSAADDVELERNIASVTEWFASAVEISAA